MKSSKFTVTHRNEKPKETVPEKDPNHATVLTLFFFSLLLQITEIYLKIGRSWILGHLKIQFINEANQRRAQGEPSSPLPLTQLGKGLHSPDTSP